jgi:hypothetical protein
MPGLDQRRRLDGTPTPRDQIAHPTKLVELDLGVPSVTAAAPVGHRHSVAPLP